MSLSQSQEVKKAWKLGGGPLGYGDPDDMSLGNAEKSIIIPKLLREEAGKKCEETLRKFLYCCKEEGLLFAIKCREANNANNQCILSYTKNLEFEREVINKYLEQRRYFRLTGEPVEMYDKKKKALPVIS